MSVLLVAAAVATRPSGEWSADRVSTLQKGGPFSKKLKIACRQCNGVWMSGMETSAKPLLVEMFQRDRVELNEAAQRDLARWAFRTEAGG